MKIHMLIQIYKQAESQDIEFLDSLYANYDDACSVMIKALFENASTDAEFRVDSVDVIDAVPRAEMAERATADGYYYSGNGEWEKLETKQINEPFSGE